MPIFRYRELPGNYYAYLIEGSGNDANNGLTPQTAVATLHALVTILNTYAGASRRHAVIVKKRIYNEAITVARTSTKPITFEFVGGCEIDGSAARPHWNFTSDWLVNARLVDYGDYQLGIDSYNAPRFINCVLFNFNHRSYCPFINAINTIFVNCQIGVGTDWSVRPNVLNCVFVNVIWTMQTENWAGRVIKNSIITNSPLFRIAPLTGIVFDYNCVNGTILLNGSVANNDDLKNVGLNLNGISANPQFTYPANGQYTVNQSSPCLYRGEGGEHIGIGEGFYLQANILYFQQSAINNFQLTIGRLGFIDPLDNAFIETNPIDIGQIITLESAELAAILPIVAGEFTAGPVSYSHWYPAYSAASTYHKGAGVTDSAILYRSLVDNNLNNTPASSATKWERLTWESGVGYAAGKIVQYTDNKWYKANTTTSTSWVAGEWDEVVMIREWNLQVKTGRTYDECNAAVWATIPYNATPYLDTAGLGNSDDEYDSATGAVMVFRFIAVRIDAKTIV